MERTVYHTHPVVVDIWTIHGILDGFSSVSFSAGAEIHSVNPLSDVHRLDTFNCLLPVSV